MRKIEYIAVHCTAGNQRQTIEDLRAEFRRKGWKNPGYHYVVEADGKVTQLLDDERVSNGVKGWNSRILNVAYMGGIDRKDNRTEAQKDSLLRLLRMLKKRYPDAVIQGHRDFSPDLNGDGRVTRNEWVKDCPCFDARAEYAEL